MPFWWGRRRKPWYGRWFRRRRIQRYKRRPRRRRRRYTRRRTRRNIRKNRRRKYKVRRKKPTIPIRQWQPDYIRNCKIIGLGLLVLGAEGTQMYCYTTEKYKYVPPKVPYGGGFGVENYTLQYLYKEYVLNNNIWTTSNSTFDLLRYRGCKITFYRHPDTDFIISYSRQPPHTLDKHTYPATHPHQLLLQKHHRVIFSRQSKPNAKYKTSIFIKPPKQMITKWFFTKSFAEHSLFLLRGAAINLRHSFLSPTNENLLVSMLSLNPAFFINTDWAQDHGSNIYEPYTHIDKNLTYKYKVKGDPTTKTAQMGMQQQNYKFSVNYQTGWFKSQFLNAFEIPLSGTHAATIPMIGGRYNPIEDDGKGNKVYLTSTLTGSWEPPTTDKSLLIEELPIWLSVYGFLSYIVTMKNKDYLKTSVVVIISKYIHCSTQVGACTKYIPLDYDYTQGKKNWDQYLSDFDKTYWYPSVYWQLKTLNALVESGPFIPKLSEERNSTWELKYKYKFYFKWGGAQGPEEDVKNPAQLSTYDVPDTIPKRLQITNPSKQATESIIHPWDIRRGIIKASAIKRMYKHLETDTDFECSSEEEVPTKRTRTGAELQNPQKKIQEIQTCLQSLCEENTYQEIPQTIQELIQQQHTQQQQLKHSILKLLIDIKDKQKMLQLQTGLLE
nr:MAG: ORF1 [Torque teno midi virus]